MRERERKKEIDRERERERERESRTRDVFTKFAKLIFNVYFTPCFLLYIGWNVFLSFTRTYKKVIKVFYFSIII